MLYKQTTIDKLEECKTLWGKLDECVCACVCMCVCMCVTYRLQATT